MRLLEIVPGFTTSAETLTLARGLGERLGTVCVTAKDRAGFIVNCMLMPHLNMAVRTLEEGFASRQDRGCRPAGLGRRSRRYAG